MFWKIYFLFVCQIISKNQIRAAAAPAPAPAPENIHRLYRYQIPWVYFEVWSEFSKTPAFRPPNASSCRYKNQIRWVYLEVWSHFSKTPVFRPTQFILFAENFVFPKIYISLPPHNIL